MDNNFNKYIRDVKDLKKSVYTGIPSLRKIQFMISKSNFEYKNAFTNAMLDVECVFRNYSILLRDKYQNTENDLSSSIEFFNTNFKSLFEKPEHNLYLVFENAYLYNDQKLEDILLDLQKWFNLDTAKEFFVILKDECNSILDKEFNKFFEKRENDFSHHFDLLKDEFSKSTTQYLDENSEEDILIEFFNKKYTEKAFPTEDKHLATLKPKEILLPIIFSQKFLKHDLEITSNVYTIEMPIKIYHKKSVEFPSLLEAMFELSSTEVWICGNKDYPDFIDDTNDANGINVKEIILLKYNFFILLLNNTPHIRCGFDVDLSKTDFDVYDFDLKSFISKVISNMENTTIGRLTNMRQVRKENKTYKIKLVDLTNEQ